MVGDRKKFKWEPTPMVKPPNGIISSDYSTAKPFVPSYEKEEERPSMGYLLSMEYARIWQRERENLEKKIVHDTAYLPKKFVIRGLNKKKKGMKDNESKTKDIIPKPVPSKPNK